MFIREYVLVFFTFQLFVIGCNGTAKRGYSDTSIREYMNEVRYYVNTHLFNTYNGDNNDNSNKEVFSENLLVERNMQRGISSII